MKIVEGYDENAPRLAEWLDTSIPEALTTFAFPEEHHRLLRTVNSLGNLDKQVKRRIGTLRRRAAPVSDRSRRQERRFLTGYRSRCTPKGVRPPKADKVYDHLRNARRGATAIIAPGSTEAPDEYQYPVANDQQR